jgi:hypothetical protein
MAQISERVPVAPIIQIVPILWIEAIAASAHI